MEVTAKFEYKVVQAAIAADNHTFEKAISELLNEGWKLDKFVVVKHGTADVAYQTLVRVVPDERSVTNA